ncbi:hypothetical protein CLOP_g17688 [Closterium sp. NIES-67]|nr:hypothetical protein CLOP_g17688 [Closterium sp. NIES-67]
MIHPSKLCFNRHTTAARNRLSSRPLRLAILLLLLGTLLTAAPWASRHFGSPLETSPRRYHRRRLLSSASAASSSVTWLHSVFRNSSLGQYFSSPTVRDASEATPPAYPPDAGPLHMRRHVSPDYFQPSATPRVRNETQRDLHAETASGGKSPTSTSEVCVAIASMPRVFPKQRRLPPWHFPVSLLSMLEERRSPPESADGFKDMRVVVYSSGCNGKPAGAVAATTAASPRATAKSNVSDGLNGSDGFSDGAEHVQAETSTTNGRDRSTSSSSTTKEDGVVPISPEELEERKKTLAAAMHERALKSAARKSSLDITVLPPRQDACDFVQQDEENVRQIGVTDEMASDGWEPWRWRTKLVMDFVYVMRQCMATKPKYILLLQDDTKPARLYDIGIEKFINEELKGQEWTVLALYYPQSYLWPYQHGQNYLAT